MKHLKTYKLFESIDELESINWTAPWEETWSIVRNIMNRISQKVRGQNYGTTRPSDAGLEWLGNVLCLRRDFWESGIRRWQKSEEFYDEFIDFIVDMNDESNVENTWKYRQNIEAVLVMSKQYEILHQYAQKRNIEIINITENSFLDEFPRAKFENIL